VTRTNQIRAEASLTIDGVRHEFPVRKGALGPDVIDIGALYQDTGHFAYDPGFMSTASCESKITFIDGDKGDGLCFLLSS
jgi:citrate synthase